MSEELAARLMARIAVPPMPFAPDTYTAGRMDQFTEMITQLRALPEVDKEQVLADAKARIGRLAAPNGSYGEAEWGFLRGVTAALAALTQPQAEQWHENDEADKAATAAGVADADPVARITKKVNESLGAELADACDHIRALIGGDVGAILYAREWLEEHDHEEREPGPYAKAFRERVCPVPEFPGIEKEDA